MAAPRQSEIAPRLPVPAKNPARCGPRKVVVVSLRECVSYDLSALALVGVAASVVRLGSVLDRVTHMAHCPVLIVR
jgi:hypothetical protein